MPLFNGINADEQKEFEVTLLTSDLYFHPSFTGYNMDTIVSDLPFVTQIRSSTTKTAPITVNPAGLPVVQPANTF
jgi:hypothetical protein